MHPTQHQPAINKQGVTPISGEFNPCGMPTSAYTQQDLIHCVRTGKGALFLPHELRSKALAAHQRLGTQATMPAYRQAVREILN